MSRFQGAMTRAPELKPFRDRKVPVASMVCPSCKAPIGAPCVTAHGLPSVGSYHRARRVMALRAGL